MKSYEEMANTIFKRRDEYTRIQKAKKKALAFFAISAVCGCAVLLISFVLWQNGAFDNHFSNGDGLNIQIDTPAPGTTFQGTTTTTDSPSLKPSTDHNDDTPQGSKPPQKQPSNNSSDHAVPSTPSNTPDTPPTENDFCIDSIDKINFYSAKKIITEKSLLPFGMNCTGSATPKVTPLSNTYVEYPIDRDRIFTVSMVTYFMVELHNENGFLARKLGGTGVVEVVITQNDLDSLGQLITFKRGERYYSCLANGGQYDPNSGASSREFSSHKYIEGFQIVKNKKQENFSFIVHYDGTQVVGFECEPQGDASPTSTDSVTFVEDFCIVLFTEQYITIDQLELYFKNENKENEL